MIGVGNEQWGMGCVERYKVFTSAMKARYPEIRLLTNPKPSSSMSKVFAAEYAAHQPDRKNNRGAAIAEAAFMTAQRLLFYWAAGPACLGRTAYATSAQAMRRRNDAAYAI